jgi:hypothetical protein
MTQSPGNFLAGTLTLVYVSTDGVGGSVGKRLYEPVDNFILHNHNHFEENSQL